jgi:hypothetical protein
MRFPNANVTGATERPHQTTGVAAVLVVMRGLDPVTGDALMRPLSA